ncbi:hypothetical protein KCP70_06315 [Salmonella enterica subsp. enterica]|nr:hypothetical protein KCP70_06315 [Salmonella enterica subsp. enterica]
MHSFALRHQYLQIWRQAWQCCKRRCNIHFRLLTTGRPPMQTTQSGCVSISVTMVSPLRCAGKGQMTRLHCPNR